MQHYAMISRNPYVRSGLIQVDLDGSLNADPGLILAYLSLRGTIKK